MRFLNLALGNHLKSLRHREQTTMMDKLINFIETRNATKDERGASAVEYGLLIAGIAALIVVAVFALGPVVKDAFTDTCDEITSGSQPNMRHRPRCLR